MSKFKRLLSVICAAALLFGMLSTAVFASGGVD